MNALGRLRQRLELTVEVATLDHGLRSESASEAEGVVREATALGLAVHRQTLSLAKGSALEQRARDDEARAGRSLASSASFAKAGLAR